MRTMYRLAVMTAGIIIMLASCGNAGAQSSQTAKRVQELNASTFSTKVYDMSDEDMKYLGDKPAIVDFTATWCGPCQRIAPVLEELAKEYEGRIVIYKVDIDKNRNLAKEFNVSSIPAILYIPLTGDPVMTVGSRDIGKFRTEIGTILLEEEN